MKYLTKFVNEKNLWNNMFGWPVMDLSKLDNTLAQKLHNMLEGELSPENLHCDGEITATQARTKAKLFNGAVRDLQMAGF